MWQDNFIQLYSFSKAYCIPGHRLGAVTAGPSVVTELAKIMDNMQVKICNSQFAHLRLIINYLVWRYCYDTFVIRHSWIDPKPRRF